MTTQDQATSGSSGGRLAAFDDVSGNSQAGAQIRNAITGPDGRQYVVIDATARDGHGDTLLAALTDRGMIRGASFGAVASGFFPVDNLPLLSSAPNLLEARESLYAPRNGASPEAADDPASLANQASSASQAAASQGNVVSQGDRAMGTDAARTTYGVDGTGIKVGILSDSFNYLGGQAGDIASGDLPANTTVLDDGLESDSLDEGRAMAQIVHDVAPNASIVFATAQGGLANFANNIIALADAGAKVIVDDVGYTGDPAYQDGILAQAISQVTARGVTYVTSAGNDRNRGYEAPFDTSGGSTTVNGRTETFHQFAPGQDYITATIARAGDELTFALHWDNPYASVSPGRGATADLDVFIYTDDGDFLGSVTVDEIGLDPTNFFFIRSGTDPNTTYRIKIGLHSGEAPEHFKLTTFGGTRADSLGTFASNINDGTVFGHAAAKDAISVGAAYYADTPAYGASRAALENFSSVGPTLVTHDADGNRLAVPELRRGPTLTGPNGGDTTFFFSESDRNGNGVPDFSGTSASAPHVAALAALMLEANPDLTPEDIRNLLQNSALDMDDPYTSGFDEGFDDASGSGFVQGTAVGFAKTGIITNAAHNPVLRGTHLADTFIGGEGAQSMTGGQGDDRYVVDDAKDQVVEASGGGADQLYARVDYALAAGQDVEILATISNAGTAAIDLTGNEKAQTLYGNAGTNILDGATGVDTMYGLGGNDSYIVEEVGDQVFEAAGGGGADRVFARASYALAEGQEIEVLATTRYISTRPIDLTGNEKAQTVYGNNGVNALDGKGGADVLYGIGGADSFAFSTALETGNVDRIADFAGVDDTIRLSRSVFSALDAGMLDADAFKDLSVAGASIDANDRILYDHDRGRLYYDADGSGTGAAVLFAILNNKAALTVQDVFVV